MRDQLVAQTFHYRNETFVVVEVLWPVQSIGYQGHPQRGQVLAARVRRPKGRKDYFGHLYVTDLGELVAGTAVTI